MKTKLLSKVLDLNSQALVIWVNYTPETNTVGNTKNIELVSHGHLIPVGNLMMKYFKPAIDKIISETNWQEFYKACYPEPANVKTLQSFIKHIH
jgi:hypothetical protein